MSISFDLRAVIDMPLKLTMFSLVGVITGTTHYFFAGPPLISLCVGLLAGLGGIAYVEFDTYRGHKRH
jgi:hypothetical protein